MFWGIKNIKNIQRFVLFQFKEKRQLDKNIGLMERAKKFFYKKHLPKKTSLWKSCWRKQTTNNVKDTTTLRIILGTSRNKNKLIFF